jgi:5-methylcytosine-specific restriction endonuclease McrA
MSLIPSYYYGRNIRRCGNACAARGRKGRPKSLEHRRRIGLANRGRTGPRHTLEARRKMSESRRGKYAFRNLTPERRALIYKHHGDSQRGIPRPELRGPNNPLWRGGVSTGRHLDMQRAEYKAWRRAVFERDDYTCQMCRIRGGQLQADHIKSYAHFPELRLDVSNGRTLCRPCHRNTPTYGRKNILPVKQTMYERRKA